MPSFYTSIGGGDANVCVDYLCDIDGLIEVAEVWHEGHNITMTVTDASMGKLSRLAEADYEKICAERRDECAISRHESKQEAS